MDIIKGLQCINSKTLAEYILCKYGPMSHLKLQKLIYFVEGYHLAYFQGKSLISDEFEAWAHGPVSRSLYNELKQYSILYDDLQYVQDNDEPSPIDTLHNILCSSQIELIDEVIQLYIGESGMTLEGITHQQQPWIVARQGLPPYAKCSNIIDKNLMRVYFSNLLS